MTGAGVFELTQIVSGFIGAVIALALQWLVARWRRAATARSLSIAFWEELSAAEFGASGATNDPVPVPQYLSVGGFSSQTFDSLFHEMAVSLPDSLARDLMRYHWRLKFLMLEQEKHDQMDRFKAFYYQAKELRETLLKRLKPYSDRWVVSLMLRGGERKPSGREA